MTKIVFLDRDTVGPSVEITRPEFEHEWIEYPSTPYHKVAERPDGAEIAITNKAPIGKDALERHPALKLIAVAATGYDVVDLEAANDRGVTVCNIRGYAANTVPEHTFALILALRRSLFGFRQDVMDGAWAHSGQFCFFTHPIKDLAGAKLGIFGEGVLGQSVAEIGRPSACIPCSRPTKA